MLQELAGMQLSIGIVEELILPTLWANENDLYPGAGGGATKSRIYAQLRELIDEMTVEVPTELDQSSETPTSEQPRITIMPFMGEGDEIVGNVIARLLAVEGIGTHLLSWRTLRAEKMARLKELKSTWILLSAIESRSINTVGKIANSIKLEVPMPGFFWVFGACRRKALRAGYEELKSLPEALFTPVLSRRFEELFPWFRN